MRDPGYAENLVQDVFVRFWENREKINVDTSLKSYLYSSVKNACLNAVKQEGRHSSLDEDEESHASRDSSPAEKLEDAELKRQLNEAIDKLPDKCREIFLMCKYDELSYKEIAEIQNISVNTVKTQLKRAMKSLSENLAYLKTILIFFQFLVWNYFNK